MNETRQLLKVFGVAVTDFEAEAEKLKSFAEQLTGDIDKTEIAVHLKNASGQKTPPNHKSFPRCELRYG